MERFLALELGSFTVAAYEIKFYALFRYVTQLMIVKEERIWLFVKSLNLELQILFIHMILAGQSFNEVTNFVKNFEGVRKAGHAKS